MRKDWRRLFAGAAFAAALAVGAGTPLPAAAASSAAAATKTGAAGQTPAAPVFVARPSFAAELPAAVNERAAAEVRFVVADPLSEPIVAEETPPESVPVLGAAEASEEQMAAFVRRRNPQPKLACSVEEIVRLYYEEAGAEGVRADIALCQALKETGFFAYGGDVLPGQNNYCGLGATGNKAKGAHFPTPREGVRAHIQHLMAYATTRRPAAPLVDPRYDLVRIYRPDIYGKIAHWTGLNGVWAVPGTSYGQDILLLFREATSPDASDASLAFAEKKLRARADAAAYVYRAIVLGKRGEHEKAAADLDKALALSPKNAAALSSSRRRATRSVRSTTSKLSSRRIPTSPTAGTTSACRTSRRAGTPPPSATSSASSPSCRSRRTPRATSASPSCAKRGTRKRGEPSRKPLRSTRRIRRC